MYSVTDKVAVITGGTRGIGLAIAETLLEASGRVVLNGRSETEEATALASKFGAERVAIDLGDVSDPAFAKALIERAAKKFGRLDILIHSAGGPIPGKMTDITAETWMNAFSVHVHPVFHLFNAAHPHLAKVGGAVLLISSVAGLRGCPTSVAYQTVKGALIPMAKSLAFDYAKENIRVNVLAPGIIRTRFHSGMTDAAKSHNVQNRIPLQREGTVYDVAEAAMALITNENITGEVLTIDGGMSMRITG
ncbi:MAG: SDR family oxidoreductase [Aestuariivirga sp.]